MIISSADVLIADSVSEPLTSLTVNGSSTPLTDLAFTSTLTLVEGLNTITAIATDPAGNKGQGTVTVTLDTLAPQLSVIGPADGALLNNGQISFGGSAAEPVISVTVNGVAAQPDNNGGYTMPVSLSEGTNTLTVIAVDRAGNSTTTTRTVTLDTIAPLLTITTPADGSFINTPQITVNGMVSEAVSAVTVNGITASLSGTSFSALISLAEGANNITVSAMDLAGNSGTATLALTLDTTKPVISVTAPAANSFLNTPQMAVSGSVSEEVTTVTVNGLPATVTGLSFSLPLTLAEGANNLTIRALDRAGNEGTVTLPVTLDTIAPTVTIAAPAAGLLTRTAQISVSGSISEEYSLATVNGQPATVNGLTFTAPFTLTEGLNTITAQATDRAGNSGTAVVSVQHDATAPVAPLLIPLPTPTNVAVITLSGTTEANSTVNISAEGALLATVTTDAQGNFTLENVTLAEGVNSYTAIATDAAGNDSAPSATLSVTLDTVKPVITVTTPQPGVIISSAETTISGSVSEPLASLTINGALAPLSAGALTFESVLTLAAGSNSALIIATDLAGNIATTTLSIQRDSTPPVVVITAPQAGLLTRNSVIQIGGSVDDAEAALTVNGAAVTNNNKTFSFTFALSDGDNSINIEAIDKAGNKGTATTSVSLDAIPPQITINTPSEAVAGANIAISLNAGDNSQLTLVELKIDGVPIWSGDSAPALSETVSYRLSPTLNAGAVVTLQAKGRDAAGNETSSSATILITQAAMGPGYLQGKVLDDSRGLKIEGAEVLITQQLNNSTNSLTSAADGGYFSEAQAGSALVAITKSGFTRVERLVPVMPEKKVMIPDARLTKINEAKNLIDATGGTVRVDVGAGASPQTIEITVPAAALSAQADIRLTPVSNQGLAGVLPLGWSPLAAVDIRLLDPAAATAIDATFASVVVLKIPLPLSLMLTQGTVLTLAAYDGNRHQWESRGNAAISADGLSASAEISTPGQYAFLVADPTPNAPPAAEAGIPLAPVPSSNPDFAAISASGKVVPQASPPSTGLKAAGEVLLTAKEGAYPAPQFTSGLILNSRITEKFELKSGDKIDSPTYTQDIVLYRYPCITSIGAGAVTPLAVSGVELRATFPVSPSKDYTIVDLLLGKVGIEIIKPEVADSGVMVGADGGRLLDSDGNVLVIPAGSLAQTTPVSTKSVSGATGAVGDDFTLIKAVEVNLTRQTLAASATLSIPSPDGFNPSLPLIVAKQIDVKGVAKLKLVTLAKQVGSFITSEQLIPQLSNSSTSINSSGTYYFLQAKAPIGFITGTVTDAANSPFTGAFVKTDKGSLVDLAGANGRYLLAAPVAPFTATALDLYKNDEVSGNSAVTAANQVVTLDLKIEKIPPTIISITPANGAVNVQPTVPLIVTFSKPMDKTTFTNTTLIVRDAANNAVSGVVAWDVASTAATFYPSEQFKQETQYTVTITSIVKDLQGYPLGQDVVSSFTVRKTTPPPMPPAGNVSATFPDADGFITITATQGTAPVDCTVLLINDTTGEIVSVSPQTNGSFTGKVRGQLGDEIKVVLMDYSGNQTLVSYITFKSDDGKYLVTAKGGKIEGEGGSLLEIPEGALVGPTIIKVTVLSEVNLPHPVPDKGKYLAAFNIDTGGTGFQKEVHLSIPVPAEHKPGTAVFVTKPGELLNADGTIEKVYEIIDSTKTINGRITTASPPFDGIMGIGSYVFTAFPELQLGIVSGNTYRDMDDNNTFDLQVDKPITRAVIRTPAAWNYVSYSNSNGFYAGFTHLYSNVDLPCKDYIVTAINPMTMLKKTISGNVCEPPYNIQKLNFKLAEKGTEPPDKTPPITDVAVQVLPNQGPEAKYMAGSTAIGTKMLLPVTIIDQGMGVATMTIKFVPRDQTSPLNSAVELRLTRNEIHAYLKEESRYIYRYEYTPQFSTDPAKNYFVPTDAGIYTFTIESVDLAGNRAIKTLKIQSLRKDEIPHGLDGPPELVEILPAKDAKEVMVTTPIIASFNESLQIESINHSNLRIIDLSTGLVVPAFISMGVQETVTRVTLTPKANLFYDREYEIVITMGIKDAEKNLSATTDDGLLNLEQEYRSRFKTKKPELYDLANQFQEGRDIAMFKDLSAYKTYTYISAGDKGYRVADVTDPTAPSVIYPIELNKFPSYTSFRGIAADQNSGVLAMTENIQFPSGNQYGYVRFYNLLQNPVEFDNFKFGQEKLAEAYSGIPGRIALQGNYAYIATTGAGLQVVDIEAAKQYAKSGEISDGSTIVGVYDSIGPGYGNPNDIAVYGKTAVLTTNSGHLLTLDLNLPYYPILMRAFRQEGYSATRVAVVQGYYYLSSDGTENNKDIAITGSPNGKLNTVDLTDPYNPLIIGTVKDDRGEDASIIPSDIIINREYGLVFVSTFNSVNAIDIKDPANPRLLYSVSELYSEVTGRMEPIGQIPAIVEKDGWVYLASKDQGLRVLNMESPLDFLIQTLVESLPEDSPVILASTDTIPLAALPEIVINGNMKLWNDLEGNPQMPTVVAELKLNDSREVPANVCWKVKVEYKVNIPRIVNIDDPEDPDNFYYAMAVFDPDSPRSRKGLNSKDGFELPEVCGPSLKYTIPWGITNFGGGELEITAKVGARGSEKVRKYAGYIQGTALTNKFKEHICRYLDNPVGASNYRAILNELGNNSVFRILGHHESGYMHFEKLGSRNIDRIKLSFVVGYPWDITYPLVNKGYASNGIISDGGFGIMQLTETNPKPLNKWPSYEQIWNYKKHIEAGVALIQDKLNYAKDILEDHPLTGGAKSTFLRMEVYNQYGPHSSKYWKWHDRRGWIPRKTKQIYADKRKKDEDKLMANDFTGSMSNYKYIGE